MVEIRQVAEDEIEDPRGLFGLIDRVQAGVPYNDTSGSLIAAQWAPRVLAQSDVILLAMKASDVVGYCIGQPYRSYAGFLNDASAYGVEPDKCLYLSEFGVDTRQRQKGFGSQLIARLRATLDNRYESILVRTMLSVYGTADENPAIAFYRKSGFELVKVGGRILIEDSERFIERPRVFLGCVDKRDSHWSVVMIQAGICYGDQLGTRPDDGRRMGVL